MHATAHRVVAHAQAQPPELADRVPPPALLLRMLSISLARGFGLEYSGAELAALVADGIRAQYRGDDHPVDMAPDHQLLHSLMELIAMEPTPTQRK